MFRMMFAGEQHEVEFDGEGFEIEPHSDELDAVLEAKLLQVAGRLYLPTPEMVEFAVGTALGLDLEPPELEVEDEDADH